MRDPARESGRGAGRRRGRRTRGAVVAVAAGATALCVAGGGVALALGSGDDARYRTATASLGSVAQSVDVVGTVASAARRDAAFWVAGTVEAVAVGVGDTVAAGDLLATIDDADLQADVDAATSALADAQQTLEDDLESQTTTSTSTSTSTSTTSTSTSTTSASTTSTSMGAAGTASGAPASSETVTGVPTAAPSGAPGDPTTPSDPSDPGEGELPEAVQAALDAVGAAQTALLEQYGSTSALLADSGEGVTAAGLVCQELLDAAAATGAPSTGDVLTLTPGTVAAGAALRVDATGVAALADGGTYTLVLTSSGTVLAEVTPTDGAVHVGVLVPAGAAGQDAVALVGPDGTVATTALTVTPVDDSALPDALAACQGAIGDVLTGQQGVAAAQQDLLDRAAALDTAVDALADAVRDSDGSSDPTDPTDPDDPTDPGDPSDPGRPTDPDPEPTPPGTDQGTGDGTGQDTPGTGTQDDVASAADVLADRAAIELAQAELDVAESRLTLADLTAPIAGTVAAVSIEEGAAVTAASDTAVVTIVGGDGFVVTSTVTLGEVDLLEVGQPADVTVRTTDDPLTATVSSIGLLNAEATSTTPSYTVELAVDPTDARLFDGSSAQVTIAVADGDQVLTVPTSAVHVADGATTVDVLSDGAVSAVAVTTGAVGSEVTEVVDGLTAGDEVVLADLTQQLVTDGESSSGLTGLSGSDDEDAVPTGPGGFGGDFAPPGGFGGRPGE